MGASRERISFSARVRNRAGARVGVLNATRERGVEVVEIVVLARSQYLRPSSVQTSRFRESVRKRLPRPFRSRRAAVCLPARCFFFDRSSGSTLYWPRPICRFVCNQPRLFRGSSLRRHFPSLRRHFPTANRLSRCPSGRARPASLGPASLSAARGPSGTIDNTWTCADHSNASDPQRVFC